MVQRYIQAAAGGVSPHCYDALRLAFGKTVNAIKDEGQRIAEVEAKRKAEFMSRPMLRCHWHCGDGKLSIGKAIAMGRCPDCDRPLVYCSACNRRWLGGDTCQGCDKPFR